MLLEFKNVKPYHRAIIKRCFDWDNFQKWKLNHNIVLVGENIKYILNVPKPPVPNNTTTCYIKAEYDQRVASNNKAIAYMLASMNDILQTKFEN